MPATAASLSQAADARGRSRSLSCTGLPHGRPPGVVEGGMSTILFVFAGDRCGDGILAGGSRGESDAVGCCPGERGDEMWWHQLEQEVRATGHRRHAIEMYLHGTMV